MREHSQIARVDGVVNGSCDVVVAYGVVVQRRKHSGRSAKDEHPDGKTLDVDDDVIQVPHAWAALPIQFHQSLHGVTGDGNIDADGAPVDDGGLLLQLIARLSKLVI